MSTAALAFVGLVDSDQFKNVLNELANGSCNPKERRRLVREVREAIQACAAAQVSASVKQMTEHVWISTDERLPTPYEEVRILFNGVPRIARLAHNREYFQLATFMDSTKHQYIASFDHVTGWMSLPDAPKAGAMLAERAK